MVPVSDFTFSNSEVNSVRTCSTSLESLDMVPDEEYENETIDGAIHIFTPELRKRHTELPKDRKIILFCNTGFQSYVASRILLQQGFNNVYSLTEGIELYKVLTKDSAGKQEVSATVG